MKQMTISLDSVTEKNMMKLKKLNVSFFPVRYNDKCYFDALSSGEFTKLAYYSDICVGAIACHLEKKENGAVRVYIMILGVLAPYRGLGIGCGARCNTISCGCVSKVIRKIATNETMICRDKSKVILVNYDKMIEDYKQKGITKDPNGVYFDVVGGRKKGLVPGSGSASNLYYKKSSNRGHKSSTSFTPSLVCLTFITNAKISR